MAITIALAIGCNVATTGVAGAAPSLEWPIWTPEVTV